MSIPALVIPERKADDSNCPFHSEAVSECEKTSILNRGRGGRVEEISTCLREAAPAKAGR